MLSNSAIYKYIRILHARGLSNRKISADIGISRERVARFLRSVGLKYNGSKRISLVIGKDKRAKCSKCHKRKHFSNFRVQRSGAKYPYRLSYCDGCRRAQVENLLNKNIDSFLKDRYRRLCIRAKKKKIKVSISLKEFIDRYRVQKGICFYTDVKMVGQVGRGCKNDAISVDKIENNRGYSNENTVFCTRRANSIKQDLNLNEIKRWLPTWYKRIKKFQMTIARGA